MSPRVVCLVPARNAAADLPRLLEAAPLVCDAIVALDDGSTDGTGDLLAAHPLVVRLLTNPVRPDYRDWDDAGNRNRLLEAAAAFDPEWILSLDADERIDPGDAAALRAFLATDALPGCAYGFHHVPMRGDPDHYLPRFQWVYRLFSYAPGQRFPNRRLHFTPIPTAIPRALWFRTTLRIQHFGSLTADRRVARFEKYLEADPDRTYQSDYRHLLYHPAPSELLRWHPRPPDLPVLDAALGLDEDGQTDRRTDGQTDGNTQSSILSPQSSPALSAIVIARDNEATIARTVASVVGQECPEPYETIVVVSGTDRTAAVVRERFPQVTLIDLPKPALPGEARNAGLRVARGEFVSFPGSHVELPQGSLAARLRAHRRGYAMVTGVAENGTRTRAGWASYFLDHAWGLPGHVPSVLDGPPAHCSYAREPLLAAGAFPEGVRTAEDTAVNRELVRRGYVALRDPAIRFVHNNPCRTPWRLVRHHVQRGRGWGRLLVEDHRTTGHLLNREVVATRLVHHLPARWRQIAAGVGKADPELRPQYERARPLIAAGAVASWLGMWYEVFRPTPGKWAILRGRPVWTLVFAGRNDRGARAVLVRLDLVAGEARAVALPPDLPLALPDGRRVCLDAALAADGEAPRFDVRGLIGHAVDLDLDAALIVAAGTLPPPGAPLSLAALVAAAGTTMPGDVDTAGIARLQRRFGAIGVRPAPPLGDDPAALAASLRTALGLPAPASADLERMLPDTWWP
jgi:glycosyltransferase involved in cell wall biosynthesis